MKKEYLNWKEAYLKAVNENTKNNEIEEAPLVLDDMSILKTFFSEIEGKVSKLKRMKQDEKTWPI